MRTRLADERNALVGTPDGVCRGLEALNKAGVEYVLLTILGGTEQLRSFARDIMPAFSGKRSPMPQLAARFQMSYRGHGRWGSFRIYIVYPES